MASTRNINSTNDYKMEQRMNDRESAHILNPQRLFANHNAYPCFGTNVGHMPLKNLSHNGVDVESSLFGINSTNLVNPQQPVVAQPKHISSVQFFERIKPVLPESLVIENNQRPFPVPK